MEVSNSIKNSLSNFKNAPLIELDIELSIEKKYEKILQHIDLEKCKYLINEVYNQYASYFSILNYYLNCNYQHWDELTYLAKILDITQYKLYTFGVIMDNINKTSSVCHIFENKKFVIKSFEFNSNIDIKPLIYKAIFSIQGFKQYETVNIFGSIGFYNVKNFNHNYTISFSSRSGDNNFTYKTSTTSCLLRSIAERNLTFDQALEILCKTKILQPVYFLTCKYNQKFSFVIQRDTNNHQIIKKETVVVTDTDEQTLTPNVNFSVGRFKDISRMTDLPLQKFINQFITFPIVRGTSQFLIIQNEEDTLVKII